MHLPHNAGDVKKFHIRAELACGADFAALSNIGLVRGINRLSPSGSAANTGGAQMYISQRRHSRCSVCRTGAGWLSGTDRARQDRLWHIGDNLVGQIAGALLSSPRLLVPQSWHPQRPPGWCRQISYSTIGARHICAWSCGLIPAAELYASARFAPRRPNPPPQSSASAHSYSRSRRASRVGGETRYRSVSP